MKILHLMLWYKDGLSYQENYLPRMQADLGNEVIIICTKYFPTVNGIKYVNDVLDNSKVKTIRLRSIPLKPFSSQRIFIGIKRVLKKYRPDIVHSHGIFTMPTFFSLVYKKAFGYKLFVDDHNDKENFELNSYQKLIFSFIENKLIGLIIKGTDKFLSVNPYSRFFLTNKLSVPESKVEDLLLGIDSENFSPSLEERLEIRNKLKIDMNDFVFVTSGRLEKTKKIDVLIESFSQLVKKGHNNIQLLIIGKINNDYFTILERIVEDNKIKDKVIFQDWLSQTELRKYYNASDVAIMPGKMSGIKDAICCGLPIIVADEMPVKYLIAYDNGFEFRMGDIEDLFSKMEMYVSNTLLKNKHAANAIKLSCANFSWLKISEESLRIYNKTE